MFLTMSKFLLIFDLDGTLVDSVPDLCSALNEVLRERGYAALSQDDVRPLVGDGVAPLVSRAFAARGAPPGEAESVLPRYIEIYEANAARLSRPYPGVRETLVGLRAGGYRTAVCTNKLQRATLAVLQGLGLDDLFDGIAGGDHFAVRKPDPGHLTGLVGEMNGTIARTAMVGDSEIDAAAARAAGVPIVLMRYGYARIDPDTLAADAVLDRFAEIPATLERLGLLP